MKISNKCLIFNLHLDGPEIDHLSPLHCSSRMGTHIHTYAHTYSKVSQCSGNWYKQETQTPSNVCNGEHTPTVPLTSERDFHTRTRTSKHTQATEQIQTYGCFVRLRPWRHSLIFNSNPNCGPFMCLIVSPHQGRRIGNDTLNHSVMYECTAWCYYTWVWYINPY